MNEFFYILLEQVSRLVERCGLWLSILAWVTVFVGAVAMGIVLSRHSLKGKIKIALAVGSLALAAHLADYFVTLKITPDLSLENNPLWRMVVEDLGLGIARIYGLTGKILLSVLSFEFFAFYLIGRSRLFPESAGGFISFCSQFGKAGTKQTFNLEPVFNLFAFMFALLGPFYFYIALLNCLIESFFYTLLPAPPLMLILYMTALIGLYFLLNYSAFKKTC